MTIVNRNRADSLDKELTFLVFDQSRGSSSTSACSISGLIILSGGEEVGVAIEESPFLMGMTLVRVNVVLWLSCGSDRDMIRECRKTGTMPGIKELVTLFKSHGIGT